MKTCLVIGAKGFIGSAVAAEAKARGYAVSAVDLDNYEDFRGQGADLLINAAGNARKFIDNQDALKGFELSVTPVMNVLQDFRYRVFIQLSSGAVYPDEGHRFSVAGHYGRETLDGTEKVVATNASGVVAERVKIISSDVEDFDTWSIQGSIFLPLTGQLAAQVNLWQGENLDTYYGGIGQGVNMALRKGVRAVGGYAQLLFDPCAKWGFALGYGVDDPDNDTLSPGMRSRNECIWGNAAYHFTPALTGMLEYSHMTTDYHEKSDATNDRVQVAMKYAF